MQKFERVPSNAEVIALLEKYLEIARVGEANFLAITMCNTRMRTIGDFVGNTQSFFAGFFAVDNLREMLRERVNKLNTFIPQSNAGLPPHRWFYDVSAAPLCYDFVPWLVTADLIRRTEGSTEPLRVGFIRSKSDEELGLVESGPRQRFIDRVMRPALDLFGAEIDTDFDKPARQHDMYTLRDISDAARRGAEIPRIRAPEKTMAHMRAVLRGREPCVITLREAKYWEHRNSNMAAWLGFAGWLQSRGEHVIFVRDTDRAREKLAGFEIFPAASEDLHVRAALYECAKCNFFVSNGPAVIAQFGSRPYLMFITVHDDEPYAQNRPQWWVDGQGISPGESVPWALPSQKLVWADDLFENIRDAYLGLDLGDVRMEGCFASGNPAAGGISAVK